MPELPIQNKVVQRNVLDRSSSLSYVTTNDSVMSSLLVFQLSFVYAVAVVKPRKWPLNF